MTNRENRALSFLFPLIAAILFVIIASFFVFQMSHFTPADPLSESKIVPDDFMTWFTDSVIQRDYGDSLAVSTPVADLVTERLDSTSELLILSVLISSLWGIPIGLLLAVLRRRQLDGILRPLVIYCIALPFFVLAIILLIEFSVNQGYLPMLGRCSFAYRDGCPPLMERLEHIILPLTSMVIVWGNALALWIRQATLSLFRANQIESPQAKHYLIAVINGMLSALPLLFAGMISHVIIVETLFALPGIGLLWVNAIVQRDLPVVMAIIMWGIVNGALLFAICGVLRALLMQVVGMIAPSHILTQYALIALPAHPDDTASESTNHRILHKVALVIAILALIGIGIRAITAFSGTSIDPAVTSLQERLLPPSAEHPMGTDELGRDYYARVLAGTRNSLSISLSSAIGATIIGGILGIIAGVIPGKLGQVINLIIDIFLATFYLFPIWILAYLLTSNTPGEGFVIAFTIIAIPLVILIVRASIWQTQMANMNPKGKPASFSFEDEEAVSPDIEAVNPLRIGLATIAYSITLVSIMTLLYSAILDYLGMGIQPPQASLGALLSNSQQYIRQSPILVIQPGIILLELSLGLWIIAEYLRSHFQLGGYD